jgi:hypothetical protein
VLEETGLKMAFGETEIQIIFGKIAGKSGRIHSVVMVNII